MRFVSKETTTTGGDVEACLPRRLKNENLMLSFEAMGNDELDHARLIAKPSVSDLNKLIAINASSGQPS